MTKSPVLLIDSQSGSAQSRAMDALKAIVGMVQSAGRIRNCLFALLTGSCLTGHAAQPWREVALPTVAKAAESFAQPPMEYRAIYWAIWGGPQTKEHILANIERVYTNGGGAVMINNARGTSQNIFRRNIWRS